MTTKEFHDQLLLKTEQAFLQSPIRKLREGKSQWSYAICDTPIQKKKIVIMGLNWGVGKDNEDVEWHYQYPKGDTSDGYIFSKPVLPYLRKYMNIESFNEVNYTNACFFRSEKSNQLNKEDWMLSLPLLKEYLDFIQPPLILLLGTTGGNMLRRMNALKIDWDFIKEPGKNRVFGGKGILFDQHKLVCVPHPQSRNSEIERQKIWEKIVPKPV